MPECAEHPQNTFVVRFWLEWQAECSDQIVRWRGRIEHVQSGEGMSFHQAYELLEFIGRFIKPLPFFTNDERRQP